MQARQTAAPALVARARQRITTRLATAGDADGLQKIVSSAYSTDKNWSNQNAYVVDERVTVDELREMIKCGEDALVVAEVDGELAGCIKVEFGDHHPELELPAATMLLCMLAVRPEFESMGVAWRMTLTAFAIAARRGCRRARILVLNKRADLQQMYARKAGFRRTGETRPFTFGGRVLQDGVHLEVFECEVAQPASRL